MESSIEHDDNDRLLENFPRETVTLTLGVAEEAFKITQEDFLKRKLEIENSISKNSQGIFDLNNVLKEFKNNPNSSLKEIFNKNEFMVIQKSLIPKKMLKFSREDFESKISKTLFRLKISLEKLIAKKESLLLIIKDHKDSKIKVKAQIAKAKLGNSNTELQNQLENFNSDSETEDSQPKPKSELKFSSFVTILVLDFCHSFSF